jgi:hypothetical protein
MTSSQASNSCWQRESSEVSSSVTCGGMCQDCERVTPLSPEMSPDTKNGNCPETTFQSLRTGWIRAPSQTCGPLPRRKLRVEVTQTHIHIHTDVCDGRSAASLRPSTESLHGTGGCASCVNGRPASPRPPAPRHSTRGGSGSRTASFRRGQGAGCFRCQRTVRILGVALHLRAHGIRRTLSCGNLSLGEGARRSDRKDCQRRARCCKMRDDTH